MSNIVPPLGSTSATWFADDVGAVGQHLVTYVGRLHRAADRVPVLYFHGLFGDGLVTMTGLYRTAFDAITHASLPLLVPELGGGSQWATPDIVDAGGYADDALAWAAGPQTVSGTTWANAVVTGVGVNPEHVAVHGWSMGSFNGLNWAWRNAGKVRAVVLVGPIVDIEKFYNDNPSFQGAIDADWGNHAAFLAALPDIDPMRNLDLIRPFGHRIQLWYAEDDEYIDPADVQAFAELVGAEAHGFPGVHADLITVPADRAAIFTLAKVRERATSYVGWDAIDPARFELVAATLPVIPGNVNELVTTVGAEGRRAEFVRHVGTEGNERWGALLNDFECPDVAVRTVWHSGGGGAMTGQQGNIMRAVIDHVAGTYLWYIAWHNILFSVPWIVNRAVWGGTIDGPGLTQYGAQGSTIPGLRLAAGGEILASERSGGIVTLVVHAADVVRAYRSGVIDVVMPGAIGNYTGLVTVLDENHLQFPKAGADVVSGGTGSWADFESCFPYVAETEMNGRDMRGRFYKPGADVPDWGDPDWTFTWTDTALDGPGGYGRAGAMFGHVGLFSPTVPDIRVQNGPLVVTEM